MADFGWNKCSEYALQTTGSWKQIFEQHNEQPYLSMAHADKVVLCFAEDL